jgi:hypothetical protein
MADKFGEIVLRKTESFIYITSTDNDTDGTRQPTHWGWMAPGHHCKALVTRNVAAKDLATDPVHEKEGLGAKGE